MPVSDIFILVFVVVDKAVVGVTIINKYVRYESSYLQNRLVLEIKTFCWSPSNHMHPWVLVPSFSICVTSFVFPWGFHVFQPDEPTLGTFSLGYLPVSVLFRPLFCIVSFFIVKVYPYNCIKIFINLCGNVYSNCVHSVWQMFPIFCFSFPYFYHRSCFSLLIRTYIHTFHGSVSVS